MLVLVQILVVCGYGLCHFSVFEIQRLWRWRLASDGRRMKIVHNLLTRIILAVFGFFLVKLAAVFGLFASAFIFGELTMRVTKLGKVGAMNSFFGRFQTVGGSLGDFSA